jgi:polar amino acid transport system substrate-binding protein
MRPRTILFAAYALAACLSALALNAAAAVEVLTGNIPPFSIENGQRPGFVREIAAEMAKRIGVDLPVTYKHWPAAQEEAKTRPDTLIYPLARTAAREPHYQWIEKVIDMDVGFATAPSRPRVENDAAARALKAVGVREGSPMVKDLKDRGYTNLVILKSSADNVRALEAGTIDAWYAPVPEILFNWDELKLAGTPQIGLKLDSVPLYIAASRNAPGIAVDKWRQAFAELDKDGTRARILASYGLK